MEAIAQMATAHHGQTAPSRDDPANSVTKLQELVLCSNTHKTSKPMRAKAGATLADVFGNDACDFGSHGRVALKPKLRRTVFRLEKTKHR